MRTKPKRSKVLHLNIFSGSDIFNEQHSDASLKKLFDKQHQSKNDTIIFKLKRIYEILTSGPPSPYAVHDEGETEINFLPSFESIDKTVEKINKIIEFTENKGFGDPQQELTKLILEDNKKKFDKSHLESINEKSLTNKQIIARRIMPLVSIYGMFYVTNKNVYFQPLHAVASKPVKIIHFEDITHIFRRRFELRHVKLWMY